MIVKHFDIAIPSTPPPEDTGWEQAWHGYYEMSKCVSPERKVEYAERDREIYDADMITEADFEQDCFLSILADIKHTHVNMLELGAGWGRMCLALAGAIDHKVAPIIPESYHCVAVEGEPTHFKWIQEHFNTQNINGTVIHGAVSKKSGFSHFDAFHAPDEHYGQIMIPLTNRYRLPSIGNFINIFSRKTVKVPTCTVDQLIKEQNLERVDIIDMDVQGAEYDVVTGAKESIKKQLIDYWLIGTHHNDLNEALKQRLTPDYDLIIDIYPKSVTRIDGFKPVKCHDGIQLYKRKNI